MAKRERGEGGLIKVKGCRFWYLQYYKDGRQIRESSKTEVKQEAIAMLRDRMTDASRGLASPQELKQVSYGFIRELLLDHYRTEKNKSLQTLADGTETIWGLSVLDSFFGYEGSEKPGVSLTKITSETARQFTKKRLAEPEFVAKRQAGDEYAGHAIINRSLSALRKMLNLFAETDQGRGYIVPKIKMLPEPPARKGFVSDHEFDQILFGLPENLRPVVRFLYDTGVRLGEAEQITWDQVSLEHKLIVLEEAQTKNDTERVVPLSPDLVAMLEATKTKEGLVFSTTNLRKEWRKACVAAGLGKFIAVEGKPYDPRYDGLIIHDLRRSAVRNLVRAGVSETVAMKVSGHKTPSVFRRYNITSVDDIQQAGKRLADARKSKQWRKAQLQGTIQNGNRKQLLPAPAAK